jgi:hypothetical protein
MLLNEFLWLAVVAGAFDALGLGRFLKSWQKADLIDFVFLILGGLLSVVVYVNSFGQDTLDSSGNVVVNSIQSNAWMAGPYLAMALICIPLSIIAILIAAVNYTRVKRRGYKTE